jgi:hypothetical protein
MPKSGAERSQTYYRRNKDKIFARRKNAEYLVAQKQHVKKWKDKNPYGFKADGLTEIECLQKYLWLKAKLRAKKFNRIFTILPEDIFIPEVCPILGIKLARNINGPKANSLSLDRINNALGYTKENIGVISYAANKLKSNHTCDTVKKLLEWMEQSPPTQ